MIKLDFIRVVIQFLLISIAYSQPKFINSNCINTSGFYANNSTYKKNINTTLSTIQSILLSNTQNHYGFYNVAVGQEPGRVNAIALCRGDVTNQECRKCLQDSVAMLPFTCSMTKEAAGWYDNCMLRYDNRSIYGVSEEEHVFYVPSPKIATDQAQYDNALGKLLGDLQMTTAFSGNSQLKFATGVANVSDVEKIFALEQCSPDLSDQSCFNCLEKFIGWTYTSCPNKVGCRMIVMSCSVHYDNKLFYNMNLSPSPSPEPAPHLLHVNSSSSTSGKSSKRGLHTSLIVALPTSAAAILVLVSIGLILHVHKRKAMKKSNYERKSFEESLQYDLSTLRSATHNFAAENKLEEGGFGEVYKGKLENGQEIAVKRLSKTSGQGIAEFATEIVLVARLHHKNLEKLLGYCAAPKASLLVYEFLPNLSLDRFLFDPVQRRSLDWKTRFRIIVGIARRLLYLHEDSQIRVVHRDLKSSNILLDEAMNPKIADFGLARLFGVDQTQGDTRRIVGTYGYMAPEYAMTGRYSTKSDAYSFGVIVLEIVSGQKNRIFGGIQLEEALLHRAWRLWNEGAVLGLVDPDLRGDFRKEEVTKCIQIGLLCVQADAVHRPRMSLIVTALTGKAISLPSPKQPRFFGHTSSTGARNEYSGTDTITDVHSRD